MRFWNIYFLDQISFFEIIIENSFLWPWYVDFGIKKSDKDPKCNNDGHETISELRNTKGYKENWFKEASVV